MAYDETVDETTALKEEFIIALRHLCWCCYQLGAGQAFNEIMNPDQYECMRDGVRFLIKNPHVTAEDNHNNWLVKKAKQGWVYGPVKDFKAKTHPDMVPFSNLPDVEKNKDIMEMMAHRKAEAIFNKILEDLVVNKPFTVEVSK